MSKLVSGALSLAFLVLPMSAVAQQVEVSLIEQGEELYRKQCAVCHQDSGVGSPPTFPALSGNDQLEDSGRVIRSIHLGRGRMPPFPNLTAEEVLSIASYIRNTWANDFGGVTTEEVTAAREGLDSSGPVGSVWDGVITEAQATRGQVAYSGACGSCHGRRLNGAPDDPDMRSTPPLARARFMRIWEGRSLATLFEYTRASMPEDNPDSLGDQEYVDIIAYMLTVGGMPNGDTELSPDSQSLAQILIQPEP